MSVFSDRFIALRKEEGLSQYDFAKKMNMSRSTISGYEVEGKEPNHALLRKFAEHFGVSTDYLLGLTDERHHADVVFQKDSTNFKKHFTELPTAEKAIVSEIFDDFYVLLFRDVCAADVKRLSLYRDLMKSLRNNRSEIKKFIEANSEIITDAEFLSSLVEMENKAKKEICAAFDELLKSDLDIEIKKSAKNK